MRVLVCVVCRTGDFGLGGVPGSGREEQFSMVASRQWAVLDAVLVHLSLTVPPLQSDALICYFHRLKVSGSIQVYGTETDERQINLI